MIHKIEIKINVNLNGYKMQNERAILNLKKSLKGVLENNISHWKDNLEREV